MKVYQKKINNFQKREREGARKIFFSPVSRMCALVFEVKGNCIPKLRMFCTLSQKINILRGKWCEYLEANCL